MALTFVNAATANNTVNSLACSKPTNTAEGDLMIAAVTSEAQYSNNVPSGWTEIGKNSSSFAVYYKIAGSSEPASYTWGFAATRITKISIASYRASFNTSDLIEQTSNTAYTTNNTTLRAADMSVTNSNCYLFFVGQSYSSKTITFTKPANPTTDWALDYQNANNNLYAHCFCSMEWSSSGSTGTMDGAISSGTTTKHAIAVAINQSQLTSTSNFFQLF